MRHGEHVSVLGILGDDGRPARCTLVDFHPSPYSTRRADEWVYETPDGQRGQAPVTDIYPWPEES